MRKTLMLAFVFAGLALCAVLALRHYRRSVAKPAAAAVAPAGSPAVPTATNTPVPATPVQPMDVFQSGVKLDSRTSTTPDAEAKRRLIERLQREEERQRPEQQRN